MRWAAKVERRRIFEVCSPIWQLHQPQCCARQETLSRHLWSLFDHFNAAFQLFNHLETILLHASRDGLGMSFGPQRTGADFAEGNVACHARAAAAGLPQYRWFADVAAEDQRQAGG